MSIEKPRAGELSANQLIDVWDILTENRVLLLCQPAVAVPAQIMYEEWYGEFSPYYISAAIDVLGNESNRPIVLWILNTNAIDLSSGLVLYDTLISWRKKIQIITIGENCHNMGLVYLAMGSRGQRYAYEDSELTISPPPILPEERERVSEKDREKLAQRKNITITLLSKFCKDPEKRKQKLQEELLVKGKGEKEFSPKEGIEWGFIDKILTPEIHRKLLQNLKIPPRFYPKLKTDETEVEEKLRGGKNVIPSKK